MHRVQHDMVTQRVFKKYDAGTERNNYIWVCSRCRHVGICNIHYKKKSVLNMCFIRFKKRNKLMI